jgi:hypothetical protein
MSNEVVVVGSLFRNGHATGFESMHVSVRTLDEGIELAKSHFEANYSHVANPQFRVYKATDPDGSVHALLEVHQRGDMSFVGMYKVIAGKYRIHANPTPA